MDEPSDFQKVMLPIIRRVIPNLLAHEITGVQPMTGRYPKDGFVAGTDHLEKYDLCDDDDGN